MGRDVTTHAVLELKISNADLLGRAVRPLIQRADEGIANYFPDEISLVVLDPEEFVHVALGIKSFNFW